MCSSSYHCSNAPRRSTGTARNTQNSTAASSAPAPSAPRALQPPASALYRVKPDTAARLPAFELEPRLTEFQLAVRPDETVTGAVGLRAAGWHGLIHSPCFPSAAEEANALPALWERLQAIARSKGLARFWLPGPPGEFWRKTGFQAASPADLNRLPAGFRLAAGRREWWTLALRDDALLEQTVEKEFAKLREAGRADTDRIRAQARFWTWLGGAVAAAFILGAVWLLFRIVEAMGRRGGR